MTELALTLLRLGYLVLLWVAVFTTISVLRRDLRAPREARPVAVTPSRPVPAAAPQRSKRRSRGGRLVVTEGELKGTSVPLSNTPITIGRSPRSTIVLQDDYVSTDHARLSPAANDWVLEDLNSTNGTWVNKTRITRPTAVSIGSTIRIGRTTMRIEK